MPQGKKPKKMTTWRVDKKTKSVKQIVLGPVVWRFTGFRRTPEELNESRQSTYSTIFIYSVAMQKMVCAYGYTQRRAGIQALHKALTAPLQFITPPPLYHGAFWWWILSACVMFEECSVTGENPGNKTNTEGSRVVEWRSFEIQVRI